MFWHLSTEPNQERHVARAKAYKLCYDRRAYMAPRKVYQLYVHVQYGIKVRLFDPLSRYPRVEME